MIQTQQHIFAEATMDTDVIEDITDKIETDKKLFDQDDALYGNQNDGEAAPTSKRMNEKEWDAR